ncbi:MAG TPA: hypothetical protein VL225_09900 [Vicinamibacterales bacterium]|nr:hypothetical protein [Vicinamibacterales bacterium]
MRRALTAVLVMSLLASPLAAQKRKTPVRKTPAKAAAGPSKTITPDVKCPSLIGMGVKTVRSFCDVPAGRDPAQGIVITLPPHVGPGTLTFDLHARHTYSEDEMRRGKPYAHYRVGIGALTMSGDLLARAAVEAEFRTATDLFDRIGGGAGPGGLKAVAPAGREAISVSIPAGVDQVSLLGETLDAVTPAGHETVVMPGRPIAIVSNVLFEYRPAKPR